MKCVKPKFNPMKKIKLLPLFVILAGLFMFAACSNDDDDDDDNNNTTSAKKIDRILRGLSDDAVMVTEDFTWTGNNIDLVEMFDEGELSGKQVISYSGSQVSTIEVYEDTTSSLFKNVQKSVQMAAATLGIKEIVKLQKLVVGYDGDKVDTIAVYMYSPTKSLPYFGRFQMSYDGGDMIQADMYAFVPSMGVYMIAMSDIAEYSNGNVVMYKNQVNIEALQGGVNMMTMDSTVYTFDDKNSVFSSFSSRFPLLDPQLKSANNIVTQKGYYFDGQNMSIYEDITRTYEYDTDDYPTHVTEVNGTLTEVVLYEYLAE